MSREAPGAPRVCAGTWCRRHARGTTQNGRRAGSVRRGKPPVARLAMLPAPQRSARSSHRAVVRPSDGRERRAATPEGKLTLGSEPVGACVEGEGECDEVDGAQEEAGRKEERRCARGRAAMESVEGDGGGGDWRCRVERGAPLRRAEARRRGGRRAAERRRAERTAPAAAQQSQSRSCLLDRRCSSSRPACEHVHPAQSSLRQRASSREVPYAVAAAGAAACCGHDLMPRLGPARCTLLQCAAPAAARARCAVVRLPLPARSGERGAPHRAARRRGGNRARRHGARRTRACSSARRPPPTLAEPRAMQRRPCG